MYIMTIQRNLPVEREKRVGVLNAEGECKEDGLE